MCLFALAVALVVFGSVGLVLGVRHMIKEWW